MFQISCHSLSLQIDDINESPLGAADEDADKEPLQTTLTSVESVSAGQGSPHEDLFCGKDKAPQKSGGIALGIGWEFFCFCFDCSVLEKQSTSYPTCFRCLPPLH